MTTEKYTFKDGSISEFEAIVIPEGDNGTLFRANLPRNREAFEYGNGEGMWVVGSVETFKAYQEDATGGVYFVKLLNDSFYYPSLKYGTIVPITMRGDKRPVVLFDELTELKGISEEELHDLHKKISQNYRR